MDPTTSRLCAQSENMNTLRAEIFASQKLARQGVEHGCWRGRQALYHYFNEAHFANG